MGRLNTGKALLLLLLLHLHLHLHLHNHYILPTRFGGLWLAGAALLQMVGIQTQRNGPLLLSFLLLALLLLAMHLTHANLQGLELRCATPAPGFADAALVYPPAAAQRQLARGHRAAAGGRPAQPAAAAARRRQPAAARVALPAARIPDPGSTADPQHGPPGAV
ncbi:MAG: hypothetical protein ACKOCI_04790, partial [Cyanobium sp.]